MGILHEMGLKHSFTSNNQTFTYEVLETDNIMDYSIWKNFTVPAPSVLIKRVSSWYWQWETMWVFVDAIEEMH